MRWLIVGLGCDYGSLELKTWLEEFRAKVEHHAVHVVGIVHALNVSWVHLDIDEVDVHHPVLLERTFQDDLGLFLGSHIARL